MTDLLTPTAPHAQSGSDRLRAALVEVLTDPGDLARVVVADDHHLLTPPPDRPWLPVVVGGPCAVIGPAVVPGISGCPTCAARRRASNSADPGGPAALRREFGDEPVPFPNPLVTPVVAHAVAGVVADELHRLGTPDGRPRTRGAVLRFSLLTGLLTRHPLLPDPLCPDCSDLPEDSAAAAVPHRRRLPKPDPRVFRLGSLVGRWDELTRTYLSPDTGVITSVGTGSPHGLPRAVARLGSGSDGHGYARCPDFRTARLTAVTEALERHGSRHPRGRRTAVHAPYEEVADRALDPRDLGLYPSDWYDRPGFPFARFDPGRPLAWVWGYSFGRAEPILVPESHVYYGARTAAQDRRLVYECSNGCALGGCLEEAILHGLLEVAERDAFLMTWFARLPAPSIDLDSAGDRRIPVLAELVRQRWGHRVTVHATTLEQGVPAVLALAADPRRRPGVPAHLCSAAAHPDPERAVLNALCDLAGAMGGHVERYDADRAAAMLADDDAVREMEDHALLHGHPGTAERLSFLGAGEARALPDLVAGTAWPRHDDLGDDLVELLRRYLDTGLDVIAVDTTSPEQRAGGFACAKVVVPGTLPMTFGHRYRRTHGIRRLATVPRLLGYRSTDLPPEDVNPHPHPFP